jgi:hypothetical protein
MSDVAISFTGPSRNLSTKERKIVEKTIRGLKGYPDIFFSGAAAGVDTTAAEYAMRIFPEARHVVLTPCWKKTHDGKVKSCKYDKGGVKWLKIVAKEVGANLTVKKAQAGVGSETTGMMVRNDMLALNCTHMVAFPDKKTFYRSGTWATINRAKKLNRPVKLVVLKRP